MNKRTSRNAELATALAATVFTVCATSSASAQSTTTIPPSLVTPDKVESRIGTLEFKDGMPGKNTLDKVYDNLDFTHAFEAFVNTMQGVNAAQGAGHPR